MAGALVANSVMSHVHASPHTQLALQLIEQSDACSIATAPIQTGYIRSALRPAQAVGQIEWIVCLGLTAAINAISPGTKLP